MRFQKITNTKIDKSTNFKKKLIKKIQQNYSKSKFFKDYNELIQNLILKDFENISEMNIFIIKEICKIIEINAKFYKSSELNVDGRKTQKLINICKKLGVDNYISVEGSKNYLNENLKMFIDNKINLNFFKFDEIKYETFYNKFIPKLSIIDLLFNCGINTNKIITDGIRNLND